jgi:hypothetical protein
MGIIVDAACITAARDAVEALGRAAAAEAQSGCTLDHTGQHSRVIEALIDLDPRLADDEARTAAYRLALTAYLRAAGWPPGLAETMRPGIFDLMVDNESHAWHAIVASAASVHLAALLPAN